MTDVLIGVISVLFILNATWIVIILLGNSIIQDIKKENEQLKKQLEQCQKFNKPITDLWDNPEDERWNDL